MYKLICVILLTVLLLETAQGKRSRKNKYVNDETPDSTPQPSVLTYSTFGFNDVGSYNGFLPTSPDYANYLNQNRDPSTRLYAPAFPSAQDTNFPTNNEPQTGEEQINVNNFQPATMNFFTSPSADYKKKNVMPNEAIYGQNPDDALAYGTKLSLKNKNKIFTDFNNTGINIYGSISSITDSESSNEKNAFGAHAQTPPDTKIPSSDTNNFHQNIFRHSFQSQYKENEPFERTTSTASPDIYKFPKVVDFTKYKQNYPTSMDNKYVDLSQKPFNIETLVSGDENSNLHTYDQTITNQMHQPKYDYKNTPSDNDGPKFNSFHYQDTPDNSIHIGQTIKHNKINSEYKDKVKSKPWYVNSEDRKKFKNMKGYEYSTNHSSTSFKYDYGPPKSNFNNSVDEISPASSNHGFTSYQLPENQFSELGKIPSVKNTYSIDNSNDFSFFQEKPVVEPTYEYNSPYTTIPTSSSHWGNIFKATDYSVHKTHPWKSQTVEDSDIIHIPKKHENHKYIKQFENNPSEWSFPSNFRPSKPNYKPQIDWNDNLSTRYKTEEDLLGLRNHDTSQSNNLPNYKPSYNDFEDEIDYRKLVEKWRQNYIRSKQKESLREYESYASDTKPVHVSMPRPYSIEVPHPVIVPVPQPYPVKVPVPKPVAVPVIREVTVPVEKPVPYPVIKKVPYPIEKPVAVSVVKQVHVPVMKPYPVAIPQIKPVFHHTKPHDDEPETDEEYVPRPDKKPYYKKSKNHRNRPRSPPPRRPSRMTYQDRNKRRPPSRPTSSSNDYRYRRPSSNRDHRQHRYHEDFEEYDQEASDYALYCKRTGNC